MTRLFAAFLLAVLMTATLAAPAYAARAGTLQSITVTATTSGTFPTCTYRVNVTWSEWRKEGYSVYVYIRNMTNSTIYASSGVAFGKFWSGYEFTPTLTAGAASVSTNYYDALVIVNKQGPKGNDAEIDRATIGSWQMGTSCPTGAVATWP